MEKNDKHLAFFLKGLVWLNVIDVILTLIAIALKWAHEANPMMALLIQKNSFLFIAVKMTLSIGGAYLLWSLRHKTKFNTMTIAMVLSLGYLAVVLYEVFMVFSFALESLQ